MARPKLSEFLLQPPAQEQGLTNPPQLPLLLPAGVRMRHRTGVGAAPDVAPAPGATGPIHEQEPPEDFSQHLLQPPPYAALQRALQQNPRAAKAAARVGSANPAYPANPAKPTWHEVGAAGTQANTQASTQASTQATGARRGTQTRSKAGSVPVGRPPQRGALPAEHGWAVSEQQAKRLRHVTSLACEIEDESAWQAQRVGYMPSSLVQMTLPHREPPRDLPVWGRRHGSGKSLVIQPGFYLSEQLDSRGHPIPVGLGYPYGSTPRLILAWVGREAVRTRSREIFPSESLAGFMRELGITSSNGGERGSITRVRDQVRRLFSSRVAIVDVPEGAAASEHAKAFSHEAFQFADSVQTWWSSGADASQKALFESRLVLSQPFFDELLRAPVPLDMRALSALKSSPMALDAYAWLSYRNFIGHRQATRVRWDTLYAQFGCESEIGRFRQLFRQALQRVRAVYPQAQFDADSPTHITILPSPPHVRPRAVFSLAGALGSGKA